MKYLALLFALLLSGSVVAQEQTTPPRFRGADMERFMARLVSETEKIAEAESIPATELSPMVVVGFTIDTLGGVSDWRFLDNTCEERDFREMEPATLRTREVMTRVFTSLDGWIPAEKAGRKILYRQTMKLRLPVEKLAKKQDADPLLFLGQEPDVSFHPWAHLRVHFDNRFTSKGIEGVVHVKFYIEPDGRITIGEVIKSPSEKLSKEVIRVIRSSKGKWTPREVRGVPQRTAYVYKINYLNN